MNRRRALIRCVRPRARRGEERAALTAFDTVEPKLQAFYGALKDEQKVRLYRNMAGPPAANTAATTGRSEAREERRARREYSPRRDRWRAYATEREAAPETRTPSGRARLERRVRT